MENSEFNLEEELKEVREKREQEEEQRRKELYDYLEKLKLKRMAQQGIAIGLAGALLTCGIVALRNKKDNPPTTNQTIISEVDDSITLTRKYDVQLNDTVSGLASETGIPQSRIVSDNDLSNPNMIDMNQRLILTYKIDPEDLQYYTQTVLVNGETIASIATEYETTIETLVDLNGESIEYNNGEYTILSNTLTVPNFITAREYRDLKGSQK